VLAAHWKIADGPDKVEPLAGPVINAGALFVQSTVTGTGGDDMPLAITTMLADPHSRLAGVST
jgi:hypothetical protein